MTFPVNIFAFRLAFLCPDFLLLPTNPIELRDREEAHRLQLHSLWRGDADPADRRMHAQVDVLDVLELHLHPRATKLELCCHQYSPCASTILKMRSTSATSFNKSNNAFLMTCSRAWTPRQSS